MNTHHVMKYTPYQVFRDHLKDGSEAPEMVYLPSGTFLMGDSQCKGLEWERPVHFVAVDHFAIGRAPVTVGEYLRFVDVTDKHYPEWLDQESEYNIETGYDNYYSSVGMNREALDLPVVGVSWYDATAYCEWLSKQTGKRYKLPTEVEWEYACRAGSEDAYCFGGDPKKLQDYAWYAENAGGQVHPVRQKQPNRFGLYDMHGNVWEWVQDWYSVSYCKQTPRENPSGPGEGEFPGLRGGSWPGVAGYCRSDFRSWDSPAIRIGDIGFRLCCSLS